MRAFERGVALAALLVGATSVAAAQRLSGVVRESGSLTPISGAVLSLIDSAGHVTARTLSGVNGRYSFVLLAGPRSARAVHIGFRPVTRLLASRAASDTTIDFVMERVPVMLEAVQVQSTSTCRGGAAGRATLELWEQARAALLNAIVARDAKPAQVSLMRYDRRSDARSGRVTVQHASLSTGTSRRPFVAARSATDLATKGYMERRGGEELYHAPDADVMFDDSFAAEHCFGARAGSGVHLGQIGLTFEPRAGGSANNHVDVRGTLWLDALAASLVQLEYKYVGVDSAAERVGSGGTMHFLSMSNGVVFIDEWTISLPVLDVNRATEKTTVSELSESGGLVLSAEWPDGLKWTGRIGAIRGRVTERGTSMAVPGAGVLLAGVAATETDSAGIFSFPLLPPGRYAVQVGDTAFAEFATPRKDERQVVVTRGDTVVANFSVASRDAVVEALCPGQWTGRELAILLGRVSDGSGAWPADLRVEGQWFAALTETSAGVSVTNTGERVDVDDKGRFVMCGIARGGPGIRLRLRTGSRVVADTAVSGLSRTARVHTISWNVRPGLFEAARSSNGGALRGRILQSGTRAPITNADVRLTPGDLTTRTDSLGEFSFLDVAPGRLVIDIRRLGFRAKRDSVTIDARKEVVREIELTVETTQLDTVRTNAPVVYKSPRLQAFEERRARGFGRFLPETELRAHDSEHLGSYISSRVPGLRQMSYRGFTLLASNRGSSAGPLPLAEPRDSRSPRGCWVDVYVDGHPIYTGPPQSAPNMDLMLVNEWGGVEYYAPGALLPQEFNSIAKGGCGVLLLWTRER